MQRLYCHPVNWLPFIHHLTFPGQAFLSLNDSHKSTLTDSIAAERWELELMQDAAGIYTRLLLMGNPKIIHKLGMGLKTHSARYLLVVNIS